MNNCCEQLSLLVLGDILRFRLEWKQKPQKVNIRRTPCIEPLSIVQQQQDTEDHQLIFMRSRTTCNSFYGIYTRAVLEFALGTKVDRYMFTGSSSTRQLVMKRGVGKVRHLDQSRKDPKMVQVPTNSNAADINTKPLGGQRIRYLMDLIGYWQSEDQIRVGEYKRREYEGEKILEERSTSDNWKCWVAVIIVTIIIGFAAVIFVLMEALQAY